VIGGRVVLFGGRFQFVAGRKLLRRCPSLPSGPFTEPTEAATQWHRPTKSWYLHNYRVTESVSLALRTLDIRTGISH